MLYCLLVFHKSWLPCASVIRPEPCLLGYVSKVDSECVRVSCRVWQRNLCMGGLKVGQTGGIRQVDIRGELFLPPANFERIRQGLM
jgi:hypothetical protein